MCFKCSTFTSKQYKHMKKNKLYNYYCQIMTQELCDVLKKTCSKRVITLQKFGTACVPILEVYFKTLSKNIISMQSTKIISK